MKVRHAIARPCCPCCCCPRSGFRAAPLLISPLRPLPSAGSTPRTAPRGSSRWLRQPNIYVPGTMITNLYLFHCVETDDATCQEGTGVIPIRNSRGTCPPASTGANVMSLLADTTIPGFQNWLCLQPNYYLATCDGGTSPATGGII